MIYFECCSKFFLQQYLYRCCFPWIIDHNIIHTIIVSRFTVGLKYSTRSLCPGYDIKLSDGEVPVMVELWRMRSIPLLPSLPGPLCPGVGSGSDDWTLSIGQTELYCVLILNLFEIELFICFKMDLALLTYNGWCAIKPVQTRFLTIVSNLFIARTPFLFQGLSRGPI